jgi:hypothetical protein
MSNFTDEDMAQVGRDLMEEIEAHSGQWPIKGWGPMDTPAEIVTDLINLAQELKDKNAEIRAILQRAQGAINAAYAQADAENRDHDRTADRHEKIVRAFMSDVRATLSDRVIMSGDLV